MKKIKIYHYIINKMVEVEQLTKPKKEDPDNVLACNIKFANGDKARAFYDNEKKRWELMEDSALNEKSKPGVSDDQSFFESSVAAIAGFNGNSFQSPKKKIKESLSLTNLLNEALDLSQIPGSAGNWLHRNFKNINNIYKNREELLKYLEPLDNINGVSKEWYKQFIDNVEHLYSKGPNAVLQYIYNSYLKSAGLSPKLNEQEQKDLFKKLIK
jgi:hypothetical protein